MNEQELEAIAGGHHGDPFAVLGPHTRSDENAIEGKRAGEKPDAKNKWEVRAFLPQAQSASVVTATGLVPMERIHASGIYAAPLEGRPDTYKLRITDFSDQISEIEDPYRFAPVLSDFDLHLHSEGTNYEGYNAFGSHLETVAGVEGVRFTVWAPNAIIVSVVGDFNDWDSRRHPMRSRTGGVWEIFIPGVKAGAVYKYFVKSRFRGYNQMKSDPYGFQMETPPKSATVVVDIDHYQWDDEQWMAGRAATRQLEAPISIYEVHLGSWRRDAEGTGAHLPRTRDRTGGLR